MNTDKYTGRTAEIIAKAQRDALAKGHQQFMPVHMIAAALEEKESSVNALLQLSGSDVASFALDINAKLDAIASVSGSGAGQIYLTDANVS